MQACGLLTALVVTLAAAHAGAGSASLTKAHLATLDYTAGLLSIDDVSGAIQAPNESTTPLGRGFILGDACGEQLSYDVAAGLEKRLEKGGMQGSITTAIKAFTVKTASRAWRKLAHTARQCHGEHTEQRARFVVEPSTYQPNLSSDVRLAQVTSVVPGSGLAGDARVHDVWFRSGQFIVATRITSYEIDGLLTDDEEASLLDQALARFRTFLSTVK